MPRGRTDMPAGPGRPKGSVNKSTTKAREALAAFVEGNTGMLQTWLNEIYEQKGPEAALNAFGGFVEYHVPKLSRTEMVGENGGPINLSATVKIVD